MFNLVTFLKDENANLQEDLMFYKSQNVDFRVRIQDLEDEMRILKQNLEKYSA